MEEDADRPAGPFALEQDPLVLHLQAVGSAEPFGLKAVHLEAVEVDMRTATAAGSLDLGPPFATVLLRPAQPTPTADLLYVFEHQIVKACPPPSFRNAGRFFHHLYHLCQLLVFHSLAVACQPCKEFLFWCSRGAK